MTGPIDTAYVEIQPDFSRFGSEVNTEIKAPLALLDARVMEVVDAIGREFSGLADMIRNDFQGVQQSVNSDFDSMRRNAVSDLDRIEAKSATTSSHLSGLFSTLKTAAFGASAAIGAGLVTVVGFGLKSAATLEQVKIQFQTLTGSVAQGNKQFADLQKFAAATPFEFNDLTTAAARFDAFSNSVGLAKDQLVPFLTTIGNLVSETGGGAQALDSISLALGQTASQGKLTLGNLEQINNALPGFNAVAAIAAVRGETTAQVMDELAKGTISAADGIPQLLKGMQQFPGAAGAMQKQAETLLGVFSTFKDTISQALAGGFAPVIPLIKDSLGKITPIIGAAIDKLAPALGTLVAKLLPVISGLVTGLVPIITPILTALGTAFDALAPLLPIVGDALGRILSALQPLIPVLVQVVSQVILALVPAIVQLAPQLAELTPAFADILTALIPLIPPLGQLLVLAVEILEPIVQLVAIWDKWATKTALVPLINGIADAMNKWTGFVGPLVDFLTGLNWDDITGALTRFAGAVGGFFTGIGKDILTFFSELPGKITGFFSALPGMLANAATTAFHALFFAIGFGLGTITKELIEFPGQVISIFKKLWDGVVFLFTDAIPRLIGFIQDLKDRAIMWFAKMWDGGKSKFREGVNNLIDQAKALPGKVVEWIAKLPGRIKSAVSGAATWLYDAGKNAIKGFINGAKDMVGAAINAIKSAFHDIVGGAKKALGISSPSKVFMEIGARTVEGYNKGISDNQSTTQNAVQQLVTPSDSNMSSVGGGGLFGPGSIVIQFAGVVPTPQEAMATGQAVGQGIQSVLARRRVANTVRAM